MDILHLGILFYISPVHTLLHYCIMVTSVFLFICLWMLYLWLLRYFCVIHTICSLVALHLGHCFTHISCIELVIPFSSSSLTWIHKSGLTTFFELVVTCIKTNIFVPTFSISYIFISIIRFFCCFLLLGHLFTWNIQHYTTLIQHNI